MNMALLQEWRDYAYKFDDRTKRNLRAIIS